MNPELFFQFLRLQKINFFLSKNGQILHSCSTPTGGRFYRVIYFLCLYQTIHFLWNYTDGSANLPQLLSKPLSSIHFWNHKFTFSDNDSERSWSSSSKNLFQIGNHSFPCSFDHQEIENAIAYFAVGMILTRCFVCFLELFFLLWYYFLLFCWS